jgi:CHAD domain-containing protein
MATAQERKWVLDTSPGDRLRDVAVRALKARLETVQHYLTLAALHADEDPEYVHQLRVWSRRATAALKLFADLLPRKRQGWLRKQLRRMRRAANDARDCDVLMQRLLRGKPSPIVKRLMEKIAAERALAQKPIVAIYKRLERRDRLARRCGKLLRRVADPESGALFGDWARECLPPLVENVLDVAPVDATDVKALHQLRIRGKELRYAMELLAGAFPPEFRERLYPVAETLQDRLGEINDLATEQIRLGAKIENADEPAEKSRLRKLLAEQHAILERARQEFLSWYTPQLRRDLRAGFDALVASPGWGMLKIAQNPVAQSGPGG